MAATTTISTHRDIVLSVKEKHILQFIVGFYKDHGIEPTMRDVCKACHIASTSTVEYHYQQLISKGLIHQPLGKGTAYRLVGVTWQLPEDLLELLSE